MSKSLIIVNGVGISFGCVRMLIGAFSVIFLLSKGLTLPEIGWLKAFQGFVLVFIDIPLSHFSDRYSRKFSICLSILTASLWLAVTGIGTTFIHFLIAELFNAISLGLMSGTFASYLYDKSKLYDNDITSISIFSKYQKYNFLFMAFFSILGVVVYERVEGAVWFISALLMMLVFGLSLFLPPDRHNLNSFEGGFFSILKKIISLFFMKESCLTYYLYLNLLLSISLQILIQYWQVLIINNEHYVDGKLIYGVAFFFILLSQSVAGLVVEKFGNKRGTNISIILSLTLSTISTVIFSSIVWVSIFSMCMLFFIASLLSSISTAKLIENSPEGFRSTIMSSAAVFSKILMFVFMPLSAFFISKIGINFNLLMCAFLAALFLAAYKFYRNE
ncbi:hypothetical protein NAL19_4144 [Pectobacterium sp. F1-1]|uniref:MFS transporter n=1 Tax=Pectobacterium sp. F1-1 TaxID=2949614 RepID=UPI0021D7BECE|nr:MFS transporter [Pectobacterium sp. F1-1]UYA62167.1 hypothetical protein NAL19_4144 [Pectobacterium sp. F1-1]